MYNKTIGESLHSERTKRHISLEEISSITKINIKFLRAIEENNFKIFPSHTNAIGFIKNFALYLEIDPSHLIAIYKRDYESVTPPRTYTKDVKPTENKIFVTPRKIWTAAALMIVALFLMLGINFFKSAFSEPYFKINSPFEVAFGETKTYRTLNKTIKFKQS